MEIKVPEGMMRKVCETYSDNVHECLEKALRWLSENPIAPTEEQAQYMYDGKNGLGHAGTIRYCMIEWQRRMFLAPEPEPLPGDIIDLVHGKNEWGPADVLEAYRRGQKAGK